MINFQSFLAEAAGNKLQQDKLKHLEHPEDHPLHAGAEGYQHAVNTLHATNQAMQGKPSNAHITSKWDGSPSIVFGHHPQTNKFFVASKSAFNKDPKLNYTNEDIQKNHGHAPGLVEKLKHSLQHLPKVAPEKGVYQGDLMYSGKDKTSKGDETHFKPNTITYGVKKGSPEGRKVAASKLGVVVHTQYKGKDLESMKASFKPDTNNFKQHSDVNVISHDVDASKSHHTPQDQKEFEHHMSEAEKAHQELVKKKGYAALERHGEAMKTHVNAKIRTGEAPSYEGYKQHQTEKANKDIEKLKSEKGKAARTTAHNMAMKQMEQDKPHIENAFKLHHHLQAAKNVLARGLSSAHSDYSTYLPDSNGELKKSAGEGHVVTINGMPSKIVNRQEFARANFNQGSQQAKKKEAIKEAVEEKHHTLAFGRMNPITSGHETVVKKIKDTAKEHGGGHTLVVSHSQDAKKNPLSAEQKVKHAKRAFPGTTVIAASSTHPTILHHATELHKQGVTHLHVVAGSDRHKEMHELLHKYNNKTSAHGHYNFRKIAVHSSGERDPDAEGTIGMSASKMRAHAAAGNEAEFHKGAPSSMSTAHKTAMYKDVRKGMGAK